MPLSTAAFPCCRDHDLFAPVEDYPERSAAHAWLRGVLVRMGQQLRRQGEHPN